MLQFKRGVLSLLIIALAILAAALPHNLKYERTTIDGVAGADTGMTENHYDLEICVPRNWA